MDNLNCKTQALARVCEENKLELELRRRKNRCLLIVYSKGASLKDHIGKVGQRIKTMFSRMSHHSIKVLILY